jgi:hypothetical protein
MPSKKSKALPIAAGLIALVLLAGFSLGLRTVIVFDPSSAQVKTTKYIFLNLPISSDTHPTWISPGRAQDADWQLMHEFHHSAAGSKLHHTHWGAIVDTFEPWAEFRFDIEAKDFLSMNTLRLINSDYKPKAIRVYLLRINARLQTLLADPDAQINPQTINALVEACLVEPIDREAAMIKDP